jgi:two-component system OmpR family sensor kinase
LRLVLRRRIPQLRTRVLVGVVLVTLVALAGFDFAAVTALRGYLLNQTDSQLTSVTNQFVGPRLQEVLPQVRRRGPVPQLQRALAMYYVALLNGNRKTVILGVIPALVPNLPPGQIRAIKPPPNFQTVRGGSGQVSIRLHAVRTPAGTLLASTSLDHVNNTVGQLELILIIGSAAAALLVFLGVGLVVRRGLRPIESMATQADRITAGGLTDRVHPADAKSEVGRLGTALNGMLTRIEASIAEREAGQEATRRFFADASHELRNPLASLRANAELYQQGALPHRPQVDQAMDRIAAEAQRMSALVDDMLRLARLDQHPSQHHEPVDLSALAAECVERTRVTDPGRTCRLDADPGLLVTGDEELLRRAIDNLLANVRAHTPAGTTATITVAGHPGPAPADAGHEDPDSPGDQRNGTITLEVSDDGPGVPADQLPHIFERFYRAGSQAYRPGSGLGLAVVSAVAAAHKGTAGAALNQPQGLRITLTLPAHAEPGPGLDDPELDGPEPQPAPVPGDVAPGDLPVPAAAGVRVQQQQPVRRSYRPLTGKARRPQGPGSLS